MYNYASFENDINTKGNQGEELYIKWLKHNNINFVNVSEIKEWQKLGVDFLLYDKNNNEIRTEVKNNWKNQDTLIIEIHSNILNTIKMGWIFTTKAHFINFINPETNKMATLINSQEFQEHFLKTCVPSNAVEGATGSLVLERNRISYNKKGGQWQSTFIRVPINMIKDFVTYQDLNTEPILKLKKEVKINKELF